MDNDRATATAELSAALAALEDGGRTTVAADSRGVSYAVFAPDGTLEDADDDWEPLVRRLEADLVGAAPAATVIWP